MTLKTFDLQFVFIHFDLGIYFLMSKKSLCHQNNDLSGLSSKITSKRGITYDIFLYLYLFKILFSGIWPLTLKVTLNHKHNTIKRFASHNFIKMRYYTIS